MGKLVKGKSIIQSSKLLAAACEDLHSDVLHRGNKDSNIILLGPVYRATDPNDIPTITVDGIKVGYALIDLGSFTWLSKIFIKIPGYKWSEIPKTEMDSIVTTVCGAMVTDQTDVLIDLISPDCILILNRFQSVRQVERNPDLRSIAGGLNLDKDGKIVR